MKCRLVQESWVPFQDAVYDRVGNILMSRVMGAEIELVDEGFDIGIRESWERAMDDVKDKIRRWAAVIEEKGETMLTKKARKRFLSSAGPTLLVLTFVEDGMPSSRPLCPAACGACLHCERPRV